MAEEEKPVYDVIGPYKVLRVLGSGSFAQVSVGQHKDTGEMVALKVINTASWNAKNKARRTVLLKREIRLCKLLHHPNIIRMIGTMQDGPKVILIMEHMSGGDLENYTYAQPTRYIPEHIARFYFRQIVSGIDYLHKNSITHRDIKPANIILDAEQKIPKLIDFGFTNIFDENEKMQSFLGSPHFAAPELLTGTKYSGPLVDVWSLAVTIYACLTGQLPFQASNMEKLMDLIVRAEFSYPDHISPSARDMITRMLAVKMEDRLTMEELRHHPWMNEGYPAAPEDLSIPRHNPIAQVDQAAFNALAAFGYEEGEANMKALKSEGANTVKNIYCLILEARAREHQQRLDAAQQQAQVQVQAPAPVAPALRTSIPGGAAPAGGDVAREGKAEDKRHAHLHLNMGERLGNLLSPLTGRKKSRSKSVGERDADKNAAQAAAGSNPDTAKEHARLATQPTR